MEKIEKLLINPSEGQFVNPENNERLAPKRADQTKAHGTQVEAIAKTDILPEQQVQTRKDFVNDNNLKLKNDHKLSPTRAERVEGEKTAAANIQKIARSANQAEMHELATGRSPPNEMKSKNAGSTRAGKLEASRTNANLEGTKPIALFEEGQRVCVWWARKQASSTFIFGGIMLSLKFVYRAILLFACLPSDLLRLCAAFEQAGSRHRIR